LGSFGLAGPADASALCDSASFALSAYRFDFTEKVSHFLIHGYGCDSAAGHEEIFGNQLALNMDDTRR
jgi:hypothetical protein